MTAIVMGDANVVYTLECGRRQQLQAADVLNEWSLLIRGLPFLRTNDDWRCIHWWPCHSPCFAIFRHACRFVVHRSAVCWWFVRLPPNPTNVSKSGSTLAGKFWGEHLDGDTGTIGFPLERRVTVMLITILSRFDRVKSDTPPTSPRRMGKGPPRSDEKHSLVSTWPHCSRDSDSEQTMSSEWDSSRRASPYHRTRSSVGDQFEDRTLRESSTLQTPHQMVLTGASHPSRRKTGSSCTIWPKKRENTSALIGEDEEPASNMHDGRAATVPIPMKLDWITMFSYRFSTGKHINLLELQSLISLLRRITRQGIRARRLLVLVDSRVILGAVSKGRSSSRKINFLLRQRRFWCLFLRHCARIDMDVRLDEYSGFPSRNKRIEYWYASLLKLTSPPTAVFASVHALAELNLLREPLSIGTHTVCEHFANHSKTPWSSTAREQALPEKQMNPTSEEDSRRLQTTDDDHPESVKNSWSEEGAESQKDGALDCYHKSYWSCDDPIFIAPGWFSTPSGSPSACGIAVRIFARRIVVSCRRYRKTSWSETCTSFARSRRLDARRSAHHCVALWCDASWRHGLRERQWRSRRIGTSLHLVSFLNLFYVRDPRTRTSRHSHFGLETLRASDKILWDWSGRTSNCGQYPSDSRMSQNFLFWRSFRFIVCYVQRKTDNFDDATWHISDGSLTTRYEKVSDIVHSREVKTRKMTNHAAQQHVLLE